MYTTIKPKEKILNILILGGGPIGLFAGYKLLKKGHNIVIFEKRKEYTRRNIVGIADDKNMNVWSLLPSEITAELTTSYFREESPKDKPYEDFRSNTVYIIISELEMALEKHFKLLNGIIIKPEAVPAFTDITIDSNLITYKEADQIHSINLLEFDIILMNDGANSFYRNKFFSKTSYTNVIENNIFYYGRDPLKNVVKISNNVNDIQQFSYGLIMIYEHENQLNDILHARGWHDKQDDMEYLLEFDIGNDENGINMKDILLKNLESSESIKTVNTVQNLVRMFANGKYIYISAMINPIDIDDFDKSQAKKLKYDDLSDKLKLYMKFAVYYFDLSNIVDPRSEKCIYNIFPVTFKSVKQSCTFIKYDNRYKFISLLGDAMVSGHFHAGIVLNRNLMAVNHLCQMMDDFIDSHPKNNNDLDVKFLKLLFYHGNLSNLNAINYIINKSLSVVIDYQEIDKQDYHLNLNKFSEEFKYIIFCKKHGDTYQLCDNSQEFIKFLLENQNNNILQRILKYMFLSNLLGSGEEYNNNNFNQELEEYFDIINI